MVARGAGAYGLGRLCAVAVVVAVSLLLLGVSSAVAAKGVVGTFGASGQGDGQFTVPSGIAVNQTSGDVYVADVPFGPGDAGGQRVEQFSADGAFVRTWGWGVATGADAFEVCTSSCQAGAAGSGDGQFAFALQTDVFQHPQVAVDQSDGSVYVADPLNDRVQKFSASGAFLGVIGSSGSGPGQLSRPQGVAVDPVSGDVYVADTANNRVQQFDGTGTFLSELGTVAGGSGDGEFLGPRRVAVDSVGRLYVLDDGNGRIQRFDAVGAFDEVFGSASVVIAGGGQPGELAVDSVGDHVYVAATTADLSAYAVIELDPAGAVVDVHAPNAGPTFGGLALRSSTGRIYASDLFQERVVVLDEVVAPTVAIDPVGDVSGTGATFSGTVNPQGPPNTSYRFEYSTDGVNWSVVPSSDVAVGGGTSDVAVSQTVTGLAPNTQYSVRLVATKAFNAGSATSLEVTFTTDVAVPRVRALGVGSSTGTAAWLGGEVNPRNSPASAYVEYTLESDTEYDAGTRLPAAPEGIDVGGANEYVTVTQLATGLQPGTEYRYRVVATNEAGTIEGPERVFVTPEAAPEPPPGRGYELVSPPDKNGGDIDRDIAGAVTTSGASASGDRLAYGSAARFAGLPGGDLAGQYRSVRDPNVGWSTEALNPPFQTDPNIDVNQTSTWFLSEDLSRAVVDTNFPLQPLAPLLGDMAGMYLREGAGASTSYRLLSVPDGQLPAQSTLTPFTFVAASPDLGHVVFDSVGAQLTSDPIPDEPNAGVYEWVDGQVRLVSKLPSGGVPPNAAGGTGTGNGSFHPGLHVISDDGGRIYFSTPTSFEAAPLYVREQGTVTRPVSVSERDGDDPSPQPARFLAAKADDGALALFSSREKLTEGATACGDLFECPSLSEDLYLWDANAPSDERLTDLTTADPDGGGVQGIAAVTDDLSRAFFVATGDLAEGAADGGNNLYVWSRGGGVRHVATLSGDDAAVWSTNRSAKAAQYRDARLSADGSRLLFASRARVTAQDTGGTKQLYLYDVEDDRLACVSCAESAPTGDSWLFFRPDVEGDPLMPYRLPRNLSVDGERVLFETDQGLVGRDTNGRGDVYMWSGGELSLISTGKGVEGSKLVDASADGRDVFFTTRERLVGADMDAQVDVYDARIGGGFPEQQVPLKCLGDECQGLLAAAPKLADPVGGRGTGDLPGVKRASLRIRPLSTRQRRALAAGRTAMLSVRVNKPGRVVARGTARVGGRTRVVVSASKRARRAGSVRLGLRLSKAGRERLRASGRMRMSLNVRFAGASRAVSLGLVRPSNGRRGR